VTRRRRVSLGIVAGLGLGLVALNISGWGLSLSGVGLLAIFPLAIGLHVFAFTGEDAGG
jgi:hypothetical protein